MSCCGHCMGDEIVYWVFFHCYKYLVDPEHSTTAHITHWLCVKKHIILQEHCWHPLKPLALHNQI